MALFKYKAISKEGKTIEDTYEAKSRDEVIRLLRQNGNMPVSVEEVTAGSKDISFDFLQKIKVKDISIFCRQFYTMLKAGVNILNSLDILRYQTENKKLRQVVEEMHEDVQKGLTLSETLKEHPGIFPDLFINMVQAGELSGTLDTIMLRMATHYEKETKINNKVKGAMVYPMILSIVCVLAVVFLLTFVMPTFVGMFTSSGTELPGPTRILLSISGILTGFWYIWVTIVVAVIVVLKKYMETDIGKENIDRMKFRIPVVKQTTEKVVTSRFTRTLSTLLASGIPLIEALDIVSNVVGNVLVKKGILNAKEQVRKGVDLATPIRNIGLFPPMVYSMIRIGEESGSLEEILDNTANFYDEEVEAAIGKMTTMIEPLMIVVMALVIGSIVIAMILPMFEMMNTIH